MKSVDEPRSVYLHPLAYLLGLEGVALLRATAGEHDMEFGRARLDEIRELLAMESLFGEGSEVRPVATAAGYDSWAPSYDEPGNAVIDAEQPVVREMIDSLPTGVVLDAACGTGRHAEYLVGAGHRVVGVDVSPEMLVRARTRVPQARVSRADLNRLPFRDGCFSAVVCALALTHVPHLASVLAECLRVLQPGGELITSDAVGLAGGVRPPMLVRSSDGAAGYMPTFNRSTGDYLRAALAVGFEVRDCREPCRAMPFVDPSVRPTLEQMLSEEPMNIWWLHHWFPAATNAALEGVAAALVWRFRRPTVSRSG